MTPQEAADLLDLVIERASQLRSAGIRRVNLGIASFEFASEEDATDAAAATEGEDAGDQSLTELIAGAGDASGTGTGKKERPPL